MSHLWCDTFSCSCTTKEKQAHMLHTPRLKEVSERTHPLFLHPFLSCWYLASHVCYHYIPLSWCTEGWGTVTDLSSVHNKRTTGNFAFEGLNMHERPKCVREGGCRYVTLFSTPTCMNRRTLCPRVTDGSVLATARGELPFSSLSPSVLRTAGRQTFHLLSFHWKTKECGTPPTHTCMCACDPLPSHYHKKLSILLQADHISASLKE